MKNILNYKTLSIFFIFISIISFFTGFYFDENSSGAGLYKGDIVHSWNNVQIYLNNSFSSSLNHPDYYSGRTPLMYILHEIFNPFLKTQDSYRISVFIFSFLLPILFYFCLKQKFKNENKILLLLISTTVLLSPYFRTSSFWGLEENYGLIFLLLSFLSLNYLLQNNNSEGYKIYLQIFLVTFFSSCCLYFDYKLTLIPILCLLKIIFSEKFIKYKIFSVFCYSVFSLPFLYLVSLWGGLVQSRVAEIRLEEELLVSHIGYSSTMIALYLFPLLFFKKESLISLIKNFFLDKRNYYFIGLFFVYLIFLINNLILDEQILIEEGGYTHGLSSKTEPISLGKGFVHKISIIFFKSVFFREIFTYLAFLGSWLVILLFIRKNINNFIIIFFFFSISLIIFPILQEYFDPLILLLAFTFFDTKMNINYKNSMALYLYLAVFLIGSNFYYN